MVIIKYVNDFGCTLMYVIEIINLDFRTKTFLNQVHQGLYGQKINNTTFQFSMIFYAMNISACALYYHSVSEANNNFSELVCTFSIITSTMSVSINLFKNRNECNI